MVKVLDKNAKAMSSADQSLKKINSRTEVVSLAYTALSAEVKEIGDNLHKASQRYKDIATAISGFSEVLREEQKKVQSYVEDADDASLRRQNIIGQYYEAVGKLTEADDGARSQAKDLFDDANRRVADAVSAYGTAMTKIQSAYDRVVKANDHAAKRVKDTAKSLNDKLSEKFKHYGAKFKKAVDFLIKAGFVILTVVAAAFAVPGLLVMILGDVVGSKSIQGIGALMAAPGAFWVNALWGGYENFVGARDVLDGVSPGVPPHVAADLHSSRTPEERQAFIEKYPDYVGNQDGLPAADRDQANRIVLDREISDLERLLADPDAGLSRSEMKAAQKTLDTLRDIHHTLTREPQNPPRQLFGLDISDPGSIKYAMSQGDLDNAEHIGVHSSGVGTQAGKDVSRLDRMANGLYHEGRAINAANGVTGDTAILTWVGYDAPQYLDSLTPGASAISTIPAEAGARKFANMVDGLRVASNTTPKINAVGHSYGSQVVARASTLTEIDSVVLMGSPGGGVKSVSEMKVPENKVFNIEVKDDIIAGVGVFGKDPSSMAGVRNLKTSEGYAGGKNLLETSGHNQFKDGPTPKSYGDPGTMAHYNLAAALSGSHDAVIEEAEGSRFDYLNLPGAILGFGR